MVKTAVVILNWNSLEWLQKFLGSVVSFSSSPETEVYVVDNGSTDGSSDWVSKIFTEVRNIRLDKNHGFAGGYNHALEKIEAKYYVLLNSDVEVTKGWLEPLVEHLDQNPEVASCQPKIKSFHNRNCFEYAGAAGGFIDKLGYTFCRGRIFNVVENDFGQYDKSTDIFWSSGACMAVRADAWKRCGGFDNDFFAHMEEVDLCWRFHRAGFRISYVPGSVVYHVGGGVLPYDSELKTYLNFRNNLFLLYKNLSDNKLHKTIFLRRILDGVAAIMFLLKGRFRNVQAIWKAHRDFRENLIILKGKRDLSGEFLSPKNVPLMLNKSIVIRFYIKGEKTFRDLDFLK